MWVMSRYGFYSTVASLDDAGGVDPSRVVVRARVRGHLTKLARRFPGYFQPREITASREADYRYRVVLRKRAWMDLARLIAEDIDYPNFKKSVKGDKLYTQALAKVWATMFDLQCGEIR